MNDSTATAARARYGVDAPWVLFGLACGVVGAAAGGFGALAGTVPALAGVLFLVALVMAAQFACYLYATRHGKFRVWEEILDKVSLRGDERLLDMGCGRGAVLLAAARRLPEGHAVGVDLWRGVDQSGNDAAVTKRNARAASVADRVDLHTGDMRELPFEDGGFDVVVSSLAIHNISSEAGRGQAVAEAVRVLRPGGRLFIADIGRAPVGYLEKLSALPVGQVAARPLGWRMWWGGPWMRTTLVAATKSAGIAAL